MGGNLTHFIVVLLLLLTSSHINAASLDELRAKAESGDAAGQYAYAEELGWNFGNMEMGIPWWKKSAAQGYPFAVIGLAEIELFQISIHFPDNAESKEAEYFQENCPRLTQAIDKIKTMSTPEAFYNLADVYDNGICVEADHNLARSLYLKAAEMNHGPSQLRLANMAGVENLPEHVKWLSKAAENNMLRAKAQIATYYFQGKGVEKNERKAQAYIKELEESGSPMALTLLGRWYEKGRNGLPHDPEKAKSLLKRAAAMDYEPAAKLLDKLQ